MSQPKPPPPRPPRPPPPSKYSRLWREVPQPGDYVGAYTNEQLEQMNRNFTAAVERAFRGGDEIEMAATATYDVRRQP